MVAPGRRTWCEPRERFLRAMNWTDRGAAMVSGCSSLAIETFARREQEQKGRREDGKVPGLLKLSTVPTYPSPLTIIDTPRMLLRGMEPLSQLHEPWGDLQAFPGLRTAQP
ncbi:hypothetical protein KC359_g62 [Hortaea werneckii]|nr:hypothetical protein KC359_g62 [Hortaea werneckii]KAI7514814.1 hypothetical protein KC347_g58 [Hortaea werneckii]